MIKSHVCGTSAILKTGKGWFVAFFEYIFYDLDSQQIVDFRLKHWADRFLVLRAELYQNEDGEGQGSQEVVEEYSQLVAQKSIKPCAQSSYGASLYTRLADTVAYLLRLLYSGLLLPSEPLNKKTPRRTSRNQEIKTRRAAGEPVSQLARIFGISEQRIRQILKGRRK